MDDVRLHMGSVTKLALEPINGGQEQQEIVQAMEDATAALAEIVRNVFYRVGEAEERYAKLLVKNSVLETQIEADANLKAAIAGN
jgi:hypothetical protein